MPEIDQGVAMADDPISIIAGRLRDIALRLDEAGVKAALLDDADTKLLSKTNDIDLVVSSLKKAVGVFSKCGFFIQLRPIRKKKIVELPVPQFRACVSVHGKLLTIDLIEVQQTGQSIWRELYSTNTCHPETGFPVGRPGPQAAWKTYKYFGVGNLGKIRQLQRLQKQWKSLCEEETFEGLERLKSLPDGINVLILYERLMKAQEEKAFREILDEARNTHGFRLKERNRVVLGGRLIGEKKASMSQVARALFYRWFLRYQVSGFPVVAFVGNDGSGKSSTITSLAGGSLAKIDPLVVSMKRKDPLFSIFSSIRTRLSRREKNRKGLSQWGRAVAVPSGWLKELIDFIDRLLRFELSLLWARAGLGPVFMDRYVTDRLRGEYSRDGFRLHPLEQFFPMPDAFIFFDVPAEVSMERKPEDRHDLSVLREKRYNYLRLMHEIDRVGMIDGLSPPSTVCLNAEQFVLSVCQEMHASRQSTFTRNWRRAKWRPQKPGRVV